MKPAAACQVQIRAEVPAQPANVDHERRTSNQHREPNGREPGTRNPEPGTAIAFPSGAPVAGRRGGAHPVGAIAARRGLEGAPSQPAQLDGTLRLAGLSAPVSVTRDALGIPTIRGQSREDVARATGFLHAQDRFFQMDLARRRAAGELAALVGRARAAPRPRDPDPSLSRRGATRGRAADGQRPRGCSTRTPTASTPAFARSGGSAVRVPRPPSDARGRGSPRTPSSSCSRCSSRCRTTDGAYEATLATMHDVLPAEMFELPGPARHRVGRAGRRRDRSRSRPIPGADVYDLRARREEQARHRPAVTPERDVVAAPAERQVAWRSAGPHGRDACRRARVERGRRRRNRAATTGSVSGAHTADGRALVANDMHLSVRVPNTWYRAVLEWPDPAMSRANGRSSASRCPACPRSSSAATRTSPGASPTPTPTGATSCCSTSIPPNAEPLSHAGRLAEVRASRRDHPSRRAEPDEHDRRDVDDLGSGDRPRPSRPAARVPLGGARCRPARQLADAVRARTHRRGSVRCAPTGWARPGRTWWPPTARAHRLERLWRHPAARRASTGGCRRRGPTARADGTDGSSRPSIRASSIRPSRTDLDGQRARRRRRDARQARRRQLRGRVAGHDHPQPADGAGALHARRICCDIQLDTSADFLARWRELILRTLTPGRSPIGRTARVFREIVETRLVGPRRTGLGRVSADARVPRAGVTSASIRFVLVGVLRGRPVVRLLRPSDGARGRSGSSSPSSRCTCSIRSTTRGTTCCSRRSTP